MRTFKYSTLVILIAFIFVLPCEGSGAKVSGGAYFFPESPIYRASFSMEVTGPPSPGSWFKYYYTRTRMNFVSTVITSAVFSGNTAEISGSGTVNGVGEYTFTARVTDTKPDIFEITINQVDSDNLKRSSGSIFRRFGGSIFGSRSHSPKLRVSQYTIFYSAGPQTIAGGNLVVEIPNQSPTADAGSDRTIALTKGQASTNVQLDGSSSIDPDGTIVSYIWTGNPDPADVLKPTVNLAAGSYTFTLIVTDNQGASSSPSSLTITVLPPPNQPPTANAGPDRTIALTSGQSSINVQLDGLGSKDDDGTIVSYIWTGNPDPADVIKPTVNLAAGSFTFSLVVNDDKGATSAPDTVTITVLPSNQLPVANPGINQTIQLSNGQKTVMVTLDGSASYDPDGTITRHFWAGMPDPDNVVRPTVTLSPGIYTFTLIVYDNRNDQSEPVGVTITVLSPPNQPPVADAGSNQTLYLNPGQSSITTQLNGTGSKDLDGTITSYTWSGTPTPAGVVRPTVTLPLGSHTFSLVVTDNQGAGSIPAQVTVQVRQAQAPILTIPNLAYSINQGQSLGIEVSSADPDGDPVILTALPAIANAVFKTTTGITARGTFTFTPDASQTGQHLINFKARDPLGLSDTKTVLINVNKVNQPPVLTLPASASVDEGKILTIQAQASDPNGDKITLSASALPANAIFIAATGTINFTPNYDQAGLYPITITASDGYLSVSGTIQVTVNDIPTGGTGPEELVLQVDPEENPTLLSSQRVTGTVNVTGVTPPAPKMKSALITGMSPTTGEQGQTLAVTLNGQSSGNFATNFAANVSQANFGAGITVNSINVTSPTQASVNISIGPIASEGPRSVSITTRSEIAVSVLAFSVTKGKSGITGKIIDPNTKLPLTSGTVAVQGTTISGAIQPNGSFTLINVPSGQQVLIVNAPNYEFLAVPVVVQSGTTINLGELQSAATVLDPSAPPLVSLLSIAGRNFGNVTGGLNVEDIQKVITDALLLLGGSEAGVLDEFGNQMNPGVEGAGMISLTQEGVRLIAQKIKRGGETVSLGELLFAFSFGFQWSENKPMTLEEWLAVLQKLVNQAWWEPNKPESYLPILMFNRGSNLSPDPPELSPFTRLNPAQAFLFTSSLWSYIFRPPEPTGYNRILLAYNFNSMRDVSAPLIRFAQLQPPPQQQPTGSKIFTQFWRNAFESQTNTLTTNLNSAMASYLMAVNSLAVPASPILSLAVLGTAADQMRNALSDLRIASTIPAPPMANSITAKVTTDQVGVPNVNVTFQLSSTQINGRDNLSPYIYSLYRYGSGGSDWKVVDRKALDFYTASSNTLTLKDTEPLPLIKIEGQMVRTPSATWFYTITAAKLTSGNVQMRDEDLRNASPWWTLPTQKLLVPSKSLLATKQMLVSDYSAPVVVNVYASGEISVDEIVVDPQKGDVYLSDTQGGGAENQPRFIKIAEGEESKTFAYSGFKFPPGHRGLAVDKSGNLYTDNAASDAQFGGRLFKFFQPDGRREFVGSINYFSQQIMFARPTSGGPMAMGPGTIPEVSAEDLYVVDEMEGMVKRVMVNAPFDPYRRVGQPFANIPIAGQNLDLEVDKSGNAYLLKERIISTVLTLDLRIDKTYLALNDTFKVTLTVGNPSSWPVTSVYPLPMIIEGMENIRLISLPAETVVDLGAGETKTFVFEYMAYSTGFVKFAAQIGGTDSSGQTISSPIMKSIADVQIARDDPLQVWIEFPDKDFPVVLLNGVITARVTIHASPRNKGDLTNVKFRGPPLSLSSLKKLRISPESPDPPIPSDLMGVPLPMTLVRGASLSFDFQLQALERGLVELSSFVAADDPEGKPLSATAKEKVKIDAPVLEVKVAALPNTLKLETGDNDKPIAKDLEVTVTIKNIIDKPVYNVNLPGKMGLDAVKESVTIVGMGCFLTQKDPDPDTTGPIMLGTLQPNESISRKFTVEAKDDCRCNVWTLVASADPDIPGETLNTPGATRVRVTKNILDLEVDFTKTVSVTPEGVVFDDTEQVDIGDTLVLYGTIRNLSNAKTIKLTKIIQENLPDAFTPEYQAFYVKTRIFPPVLGDEQAVWCDGCGSKPDTVLKPGESVRFETRVMPIADSMKRTSLGLMFEVEGEATDDNEPDLPVESVKSNTVEKKTWVNYEKPPIDWEEVTDRFTYEAVVTWGTAMNNTLEFLDKFWRDKETRDRISHTAIDMFNLTVSWWKDTPAEQKWELIKKYVAGIPEQMEALYAEMVKEVDEIEQAIADGDQEKLEEKAELLGKLTGDVAVSVSQEVALTALTCGAGKVVSVGMKGLKKGTGGLKTLLKSKFLSKEISSKLLPGRLVGLVAGQILKIDEAARVLGVSIKTIEELLELAKAKGKLITARFRHPRAAKYLAEGKAVPKFQQIKLKNVDGLDIDFLGYDEEDIATIVFKRRDQLKIEGVDPIELKAILDDKINWQQRLSALKKPPDLKHPGGALVTDDEWKFIRKRLEDRVKEADEHLEEITKWKTNKKVDAEFVYKENGIDKPNEVIRYDFKIDDKGRIRVKLETDPDIDDETIWKRITGDIDLLDMRNSDGTHLNNAELEEMYDLLRKNKQIQIQHGETATWQKKGTKVFAKKEELLQAHKLGGEPAVEIGDDGLIRVVHSDPKTSYINPLDEEEMRVVWHGGKQGVKPRNL